VWAADALSDLTADPHAARWTTSDPMRKAVETAQGSDTIEKLLESKLYEKLTNEEWLRVLAGNPVKELVPEDWE